MKRSNENENDFRSKNNEKKRKIIDKEELIEKFLCSNFYIDKTLLIKDFIEEISSIICITAPSGYGKTVNLNMLPKETKDGESYIDLYQGKFPVVYINFDVILLEESFDETIENFKSFIQSLYNKYNIIIDNNIKIYEKEMIKKILDLNVNINNLVVSISILCKYLYNTFKKKIILLIDNYDSLILNSLNTTYFDKLYSFHQKLLTNIFENDSYIFKSFITGKIDVQFFTINYSVASYKFNKYFSVTNLELQKLLFEFKLENKSEIYEQYKINSSNFSSINPTNNNHANKVNIIISTSLTYNINNKNNMDYLLQNGFIEKSIPKLSNFKMLKKEYINNRDIIWTFEIIDLFIKNYDEEKIQEFLENSINKENYSSNEDLNNWYALIYSLLSLNNKYVIVTKNKYDEKDNIQDEIKEGCIQALDDNEKFLFNGLELKNIYDKIIKFGISVCGNKCGVIYEINYGNKFKRKEMETKVYSGENYDDLYEKGYYFIDKTRMINKLIKEGNAVYLITRPRRFGKSLNLKMIQKFFEKRTKGDSKGNDVFDGLEVSKDRKNMREFHKYPVIYLNFKDNESKTYESALMYLKSKISSQFRYQRKKIDFKKLDTSDQKLWNKIENEEEDMNKLNESIQFLCQCLIEKKFYKRKCIVLIDEYDKILINSFENGYYEDFIGIIKSLFSNIFKGNENLYFGVTTGCLDLGLKSLYSGVNNFMNLEKILTDFKISSKKNKIQKEYDGYSCGYGNHIIKNLYNPYSFMKFIKFNKEKKDDYSYKYYWYSSGSDNILNKIIKENEFSFEKDFLSLLYGNVIIVEIKEILTLKKNYKKDEVWTVLLYSGYITLSDKEEYEQNVKKMDDQIVKLLKKESELNEKKSN
ncbi:hypothetical protein H8356DRAFT_1365954 [Neocallimastix lanati (nom. inval.)]|nr:hypothetical protein H8356DRAFT_1365954 [Neocallimastix sp. JGI-2020a]